VIGYSDEEPGEVERKCKVKLAQYLLPETREILEKGRFQRVSFPPCGYRWLHNRSICRGF